MTEYRSSQTVRIRTNSSFMMSLPGRSCLSGCRCPNLIFSLVSMQLTVAFSLAERQEPNPAVGWPPLQFIGSLGSWVESTLCLTGNVLHSAFFSSDDPGSAGPHQRLPPTTAPLLFARPVCLFFSPTIQSVGHDSVQL